MYNKAVGSVPTGELSKPRHVTLQPRIRMVFRPRTCEMAHALVILYFLIAATDCLNSECIG
jgi:hypothetical protein